MYLRGSKWNLTRRSRRRSNPLLVAFLIMLIAAALYFDRIVVPTIPPPFEPTPTVTRSPESIVNEAKAFLEDGKLEQAIAAYQQAILANPGNPANFLDLARAQLYAGKYSEAKINAENALLLNPDNALAYTLKAWALNFMTEYLEAEASVKSALEIDPNNALAYAVYAEILMDQGNFEDIETAIALSRKAQDLAPNTLETHRVRGYILYATGNSAEAIPEYKAALGINDKLWDLHYSLGVVYKLTGEYDLAIQEMLAAIALNPTNPDIPTEISRTYAAIGQFSKAIQYAEQALSIDPSRPNLHGNLGVMYYKNGDYDLAAQHLSLAVRGGTTDEGITVQGIPLAPGRVADDYYSIYTLSLTKQDRCAEAVPIMQLILSNIAEDQVAYYNATEGMTYCKELSGTPAPPVESTPEP